MSLLLVYKNTLVQLQTCEFPMETALLLLLLLLREGYAILNAFFFKFYWQD